MIRNLSSGTSCRWNTCGEVEWAARWHPVWVPKKKLKKKYDPDVLFIEPSEAVVTQELRDVSAMGLRDIKYDIGPFITLVDGPDFDFL